MNDIKISGILFFLIIGLRGYTLFMEPTSREVLLMILAIVLTIGIRLHYDV